MKKIKLLLFSIVALFTAAESHAQFYTLGSEPASVRWKYMDTGTYRIIYPSGLDSLALVYASRLEHMADIVGNTAGFRPNQSYSKRMPVILHTHTAYANGVVTWSPRRIELMTLPDSDYPEPTPWVTQLTLHESRHAAQMQFTAASPFRGWNYVTGQLVAGALSAVYCGPAFLEGDAVTAETALTEGGRGRSADFLEYYRVSFAEGDFRNYWKWRYGSQRHYTPDYYRAGYVTMAGIRSLYDVPDFTARYFERIASHRGVVFNNFGKTLREVSGKSFKQAFTEISDSLATWWAEDEARRAPFMDSRQFTRTHPRFTQLNRLGFAGERMYAVRDGLTRAPQLVSIEKDGSERSMGSFASSYTGLTYSKITGNLYWTEYVRDPRWEMRSYSNLRYMDADGRRHNLTKGKRYYHPAAAEESALIAVSEYPMQGGSKIVVLDASDGRVISTFSAPDGLQVLEPVWVGDELYTTALSDGGYGIYRVRDFSYVLGPRYVTIKQPFSSGGNILFACDLSGVHELYSLNPSDGSLFRLTSTPHGGGDFCFDPQSDTLYFTVLKPDGRTVHTTTASSLMPVKADFSQTPDYPFVEALAAGETEKVSYTLEMADSVSAPKRYSKLTHLIRFHSWVPLFVDYDSIGSLSFSNITSVAGLGATAFFQNDLGDTWGSVAYHAGFDSYSGWNHSGHLTLSYSGLYPVLEASLHLNERNSVVYTTGYRFTGNGGTISLSSVYTSRPLFRANFVAYVPLIFTRGGLTRGIIPQFSFNATNDIQVDSESSGYMSSMVASVRGYIMENTPSSRIYPRWGIGAEGGYYSRPYVSDVISPNFYLYAYAYVPGVWQTHGIRLRFMYESRNTSSTFCEPYLSIAPRGFTTASTSALVSLFPNRNKLSIDYAMPLFPVDWSWLGPLAYIRNFELTLHADLCSGISETSSGSLYSAGADFSVRLGNLVWIPYDTRIGISYNYKGGGLFSYLGSIGYEKSPHSISLVFSVDM